jgi:IclR family pca regulon transcriptional regulator
MVDQEVELGLRFLAVPLRNARGVVVAALNTGLAASAVPMTTLVEAYLQPLQMVARELSGILA